MSEEAEIYELKSKAVLSPKYRPFFRSRGASILDEAKSMHLLLQAIRRCNLQTDTVEAIQSIIAETCNILNCDRATVFMVDESTSELVIKVAEGTGKPVNIRIPCTAGIAGLVYTKPSLVNIPEAYTDKRFNQDVDMNSGYLTKSILCVPVQDEDGTTVAVLQAINKKEEDGLSTFMEDDETMILFIASQVGVMLKKLQMYERIVESEKRTMALLDIVRSLHSDLGTNSLMFTITERTPTLVTADRCTLFVLDNARNELWSMHGAVEIRFPMDKGLAGHVATSGEKLNIKDAYNDSRFNQAIDKKSGYTTKTILCMPVMASGNIIAVIQLINKKSGVFTETDEQLIESFINIVGPILATSQVFQSTVTKLSEFAMLSTAALQQNMNEKAQNLLVSKMEKFEEVEEEDDEDDE